MNERVRSNFRSHRSLLPPPWCNRYRCLHDLPATALRAQCIPKQCTQVKSVIRGRRASTLSNAPSKQKGCIVMVLGSTRACPAKSIYTLRGQQSEALVQLYFVGVLVPQVDRRTMMHPPGCYGLILLMIEPDPSLNCIRQANGPSASPSSRSFHSASQSTE